MYYAAVSTLAEGVACGHRHPTHANAEKCGKKKSNGQFKVVKNAYEEEKPKRKVA